MPGRRYSFEVNRVSKAAPAALFRLESDGSLWSTWSRPLIVQSRWVSRGADDAGGVGAIRELGLWPVLVREETLEYEADRRHVYTLTGPAPFKDYRAELLLTPNAAGGTDLRWTGSFTESLPGTGPIARATLSGLIGRLATQLVKAAENGR